MIHSIEINRASRQSVDIFLDILGILNFNLYKNYFYLYYNER